MEAIADLGGHHARVVVMEPTNGDGVVEKYAVIRDIEDIGGELPVFADVMPSGYVERGVHRKIWALIRPLAGARETIGETRAVIHIGGEPCAPRQVAGETGVEGVALVVVDGRVAGSEVAGRIGGIAAGEAADDVAALLRDLVRIGEMKLTEVR